MATKKKRRTSISLFRDAAITLTKTAKQKTKVVYVLVADKKLKYEGGRSRVAYIGMTNRGVHRIAKNAADRAEKILSKYSGVYSFSARVLHFNPPKGKWKKGKALLLERALLITFRERYGELPKANSKGEKMKPEFGEFERYSRKRLETLLDDLA